MSNFSGKLAELRSNEETSRAGVRWQNEEDKELLARINAKESIEDIAVAHKRTHGSIHCRILMHASDFIKSKNVSIEEASSRFNVSVEDLDKHIKTRESKMLRTKSDDSNVKCELLSDEKKESCMDILLEIRDLLKVLVEKL